MANVPSKSLLSVRGTGGRVSSKKYVLRGRLKKKRSFSRNFACAAERKYCAGVLNQLRGRARAQLRGNVDIRPPT